MDRVLKAKPPLLKECFKKHMTTATWKKWLKHKKLFLVLPLKKSGCAFKNLAQNEPVKLRLLSNSKFSSNKLNLAVSQTESF